MYIDIDGPANHLSSLPGFIVVESESGNNGLQSINYDSFFSFDYMGAMGQVNYENGRAPFAQLRLDQAPKWLKRKGQVECHDLQSSGPTRMGQGPQNILKRISRARLK
ncbi:hypothetical protein LguiA_020111 [Lonicera macranthoides]